MLFNKPLSYQLMGGKEKKLTYETVYESGKKRSLQAKLQIAGYNFLITDNYETVSEGQILFTRTIKGNCNNNETPLTGIRFLFETSVETSEKNPKCRFCIPSVIYTKEQELDGLSRKTFMEDRLSANIAVIYETKVKKIYTISKITPSMKTEAPIRKKGDSHYLHKTENCSIGFAKSENGDIGFRCSFPYEETEESVALNSLGTPVRAFYPLDGSEIDISFSYYLDEREEESFTDGIFHSFVRLKGMLDKRKDQMQALLPFGKEESIRYRAASLIKSYKEFDGVGAGFFFHFDPRKGYHSLPSGFGTSFNVIPHDSYAHILEYGFTGRQINAAWTMASLYGGEWLEKGIKVIDFFLEHAIEQNGWLYSLYDLETKSPFFSFGDESAPKLHYISRTKEKGNYLRTMTEPVNDILEAYQWYKKQGVIKEEWFLNVLKFADFLVNRQNPDGSWYRAYKPDGSKANLGVDRGSSESATAIPLIFLSNLCRELESRGENAQIYRNTVMRAGDYILKHGVAEEYYEGGTLDNPNIVDKEAAQYAMAGLYHLYNLTGTKAYLKGACQAAKIFVTWNYIWNAPVQPDTYLAEKNFKTKGFGAINSIWGGGVVDIYSLFHICELYKIGKETGETFFMEMAELIASGTAQILSCPSDGMGFTDIGMQPEGFGICPQGSDEEMIHKGDIWGTLGWIYSAGIYGLGRYMESKNEPLFAAEWRKS